MPLQKFTPHSRLVLARDGMMVNRQGQNGSNFSMVLKAPTVLQVDGFPSRLARIVVESISKLETMPETYDTNASGREFPTDKGFGVVPAVTVLNDILASPLQYDTVAGGRVETVQAIYPDDLDVRVRLKGVAGVQEVAHAGTPVSALGSLEVPAKANIVGAGEGFLFVDPAGPSTSFIFDGGTDAGTPATTINNVAGYTAVATSIDVVDGSVFQIGDVIQPESSTELWKVTNVVVNTLTVTRDYKGTTPEAVVDTQFLFIVPPALAEAGTVVVITIDAGTTAASVMALFETAFNGAAIGITSDDTAADGTTILTVDTAGADGNNWIITVFGAHVDFNSANPSGGVTGGAVREFSHTIANPFLYPIVPGSVDMTYTVGGGARHALDLWGDGRIIGRDAIGTINYETGEITMKFAAIIDAVDSTVDFETPDNTVLYADSVIDVDFSYTERLQSLGA